MFRKMLLIGLMFLLFSSVVASAGMDFNWKRSITVDSSGETKYSIDSFSWKRSVTVSATGGNTSVYGSFSWKRKIFLDYYTYTNWSNWWVMECISTPIISNPNPSNGSTSQPFNLIWSVDINNPDGNNFNWSIECSNGQTNSSNNDVNGTKFLSLSNLQPSTSYTVWVNATSVVNNTFSSSAWYTFTTQAGVGAPIVTTNETMGVEETNATLHGYLQEDGGEPCGVWFEYGVDTSYGNTTYLYDIIEDTASGVTDASVWIIGTFQGKTFNTSIQFEPNHSFTISTIAMYIDNITGSGYDADVDIYISSGGADTNWGEGTKVKDSWNPSWSAGWQMIYLDTKYDVTSGNTYEIEFITRNDTTSNNYLDLAYDGNMAYPIAIKVMYGTGGSNIYGYGALRFFDTTSTGNEFSYNLSGLSYGTLYHYRAVANNSNSTVYGSDKTFLTKPLPPTNVTITSYNNTTILFTWTKGQGANHTVILRKTTGYPTSPTDGTEVYNNTGTTYTDTITSGLKYYYSFYSYAEENSLYQFSDEKVDISQEIPPETPTDISYKVVPPNQLNITWTKGNHSDATILRVSSSSQPTSPTDGTLLYNGSLEYYIYTVTDDFYITLFSYNATSHLYSTGVPLDAYFVWLNCYNENTGNKLDGYSVVFTNPTGTSVYKKDNCTSPTIINVSDVPTGEKISVSVEKNGYSPRSYVFKILNITSNYFIDVFLLPIETTTEECTLMSFVDTKIVTNPNVDNVISLSKTLETISGVEIYNKSLYPEYNLQSFIDSKSVTNTSVNLTINLTYPLEQIYAVEVYNETLYGTYGGWLFVSNDKYKYNTTQVEIDSSVFDSNTTIARVTYYYLHSISSTGGWVTVDADKYTYNTTSVTVNQTILDSNITTIRVSYYYKYCTEGAEQKYLYQIEVINQNNLAVPSVKVTIARYINETFGFKNISILYTDGAGHITIYLKPFTLYKFILEKTGYQNETADWTPNDAIFTHTFLMESTQYETPSNYTPPLITITRNGTTITVSYYDTLGLTLDVNTILYYYNATGSLIQVSSVQNTSENNINIQFKNTNTTYTYRIIIHYNQTIGHMIYTKTINPVYAGITTPATLNTILVAILGQAGAFLWTNLILFLAFAVMMFASDKKHAGKYLILIGGIMAFVAIIGFHSAFSASIPTLFVIVGIILEWINARRGG